MGIAAAFNIIAAACGLGFIALVFIQPPGIPKYGSDFWGFVIVLLVFAAFTLAGGIQALRARTWRLTFASSIFAIILTPSLGIPALIFTLAYKPVKQPKEPGTTAGESARRKKFRWWLIPWLDVPLIPMPIRARGKKFRWWLIPIFVFCIPLAAIPLLGMWL